MDKKAFIFLGISFLAAVFACFDLMHYGLPPTHDGEYHVIRFFEFDKVLRDGNLYPRFAPDLNNGFGLPLFNYVYPLPNYFSSFFHFLGFNFINSFKLNIFLASAVGSIFFYLWSRKFWGDIGGLVSSIFFTFSPYHFLDIYIRGSVGEIWALALFPAFLWSSTNFIKNRDRISFVFSSLSLSLIIFAHNILSLMFLPLGVSYFLYFILKSENKKQLVLSFFIILLTGLGMSSIFWMPAIFEKQFVTGLQVFDFSFNFPEIYELIFPSWGSGFSGGDLKSQLSFQIGLANLFVVLIVFIQLFFKRKTEDKKTVLFFIFWFFILIFLMLQISLPLWQNIPLMAYFQFPWRFLSIEILVISFLAGSTVYFIKSTFKKNLFACFLIFLTIALGIGYAKSAYYLEREDQHYITRSNFIDGTNSPGNAFNTIWMKNAQKSKSKAFFSRGDGNIKFNQVKSTNYNFNVSVKTDSEITINTAYFPGWKVYDNGKNIETKITSSGLFSFSVSKGEHNIKVKFEDTLLRKLSVIVSIASIAFLLLFKPFGFVKIK